MFSFDTKSQVAGLLYTESKSYWKYFCWIRCEFSKFNTPQPTSKYVYLSLVRIHKNYKVMFQLITVCQHCCLQTVSTRHSLLRYSHSFVVVIVFIITFSYFFWFYFISLRAYSFWSSYMFTFFLLGYFLIIFGFILFRSSLFIR